MRWADEGVELGALAATTVAVKRGEGLKRSGAHARSRGNLELKT